VEAIPFSIDRAVWRHFVRFTRHNRRVELPELVIGTRERGWHNVACSPHCSVNNAYRSLTHAPTASCQRLLAFQGTETFVGPYKIGCLLR
jgi:hypothetical protein